MYKIFGLISYILLFFIFTQWVIAGECKFDPSIINKEYFLSNTKFTDCIWNNQLNEAKVTSLKDSEVTIKYFACNHFGIKATYVSRLLVSDVSVISLAKEIKWLGSMVLEEKDYGLLVSTLSKTNFAMKLKSLRAGEGFFVLIEDSDYDEFIVNIAPGRSAEIVIELSWYIS